MIFLCSTHKPTLLTSSHEAVNNWEHWMNEGQTLFRAGKWHQAVMFFGCSFEITQWLVAHLNNRKTVNTQLSYAERLMLAGHSLAECFNEL